MPLPPFVDVRDDTMREGLQIESKDIPVEDKLRLLDALGETGLKTISIGSFASPRWMPQMACIDEIASRFTPKPGVRYTAVAFNKRGFERAGLHHPKIHMGSGEFNCHVEVGRVFALRNYNRTPEQMMAAVPGAVARARKARSDSGGVAVGNPFGSNFEGDVPLAQAMGVLAEAIDHWHAEDIPVRRLQIIDDMGLAMPHTLIEMLEAVRDRWPEIDSYRLHLHNQRGTAALCYHEALKWGVTCFDTSLGGLGGCPYCGNGRSAGHVPTEDFVYLCHEMGVETGLNLDKLIEAAAIAEEVVGHPLWGHVSKSGPRPRNDTCYPRDMPFVETLEEASHFRNGPGVYAHQVSPWGADSPLFSEA